MESKKWCLKFIISHAVSIFLAIAYYLTFANNQLKQETYKIVPRHAASRTFYTLKFLIVGTLFFINTNVFAQKLFLENNVSQTNYKLGYLRHVRISSINDSTRTFGAYISKAKNDTLCFIGGKKIALADINTISFTPRNTFTKYGKPYLYSAGIFISGFVALIISGTEQTYSIGQRLLFFVGGTLYSSVLIEAAGTGFWIITPKRELRKGINLTILNK
ncbi:MAG: hypothetical protein JHD28_04925 [Bacteroidia bacterium]|nr:hypothetical protein [Bacteroidia bacterium]